MIAFVCEVIQLLWTLTLFVGEVVFLVFSNSKGVPESCRSTHYDRAIIFSIIVLFPIILFNISSIRYRWHMKVRRERTRAWFREVARRTKLGGLPLKRLGAGAPGQPEAEPLGEGANIPPRPERQRNFNRSSSSSSWELAFMAAEWVATIYLSWCLNKYSMYLCGQSAPEVRYWLYVINILQWCHLIFGWVVRPIARAYSNRRHLITAPLRAPTTNGVPDFVTRVCYVPNAEEWKGNALPHEPVVLDADQADCPICYDEYPAPSTNIVTKSVSAPTLWRTRCGHVFHDTCLLEWLRTSGGTICPYCNQDAATVPDRNQEAERAGQAAVPSTSTV